MTDTPTGLDEAVRMFAGYIRGENGFDELDFKEWLIDWNNKQTEEVLDRLESNREALYWWTGGEYDKTTAVDMRAIAAERAKLKEVK